MTSIKKEFKSVNSKELVTRITNLLDEGMEELGVTWTSESQRSAFVGLADDLLHDLLEEQKIELVKVICDRRNNTTANMDKGLYLFEVHFKQRHCLNITKIMYHIDASGYTKKKDPDYVI